jgi:hypothetical protein
LRAEWAYQHDSLTEPPPVHLEIIMDRPSSLAAVLAFVLVALIGCDGAHTATQPQLDDEGEPSERFAMSLDSTVVWSRSGTVDTIHRANDRVPPEAAPEIRGPLSADSIRSLRDKLSEFNGSTLEFALMLDVADAWALRSQEEVRVALAELPVRVVTSSGDGGDGKTYQRRDYYVHNVLTLTMFLSTASKDRGSQFVFTPDEVWCETEFQGTVYVDVCATEQDLNDAAITLAALEYEVAGYQEAYDAGVRQICGDVPDPTCLPPVEAPIQFPFVGCSLAGPAAAPGECAMEATSAVAALYGWGLAKNSAHGLMMAGANVTARRALFVGLGGAVSAAFGVGFGVGTFLACVATT